MFGEDLLDLLQALAAEVLGLEHVLLGALHELADEL